MQKQDSFIEKRIVDLANQSYRNHVYTFTGFLSPDEQDIFYRIQPQIGQIAYTLYGGVEGCERQVLRFGSEETLGYPEEFPIDCVQIRPLMPKFADKLTHRDFLGALMNLGIERSTLGDIIVKDACAYLFCLSKVTSYIMQNLSKIRHTNVKCEQMKEPPQAVRPRLEPQSLIVGSPRLDGVIAKLYHLSRSQSVTLFRDKKVFVNGRCTENNSGSCKEGDVISVRGFGKFVYNGSIHETKKGNLSISVSRYV